MRMKAILALLAVLAPSGALAGPRVADLLGKTDAEVYQALELAGARGWVPGFAAKLGDAVVTAGRLDLRGLASCDGYAGLRGAEASVDTFLFRDGRLGAVTRSRPTTPATSGPTLPAPASRKAAREEMKAARRRSAGPLPLEAGPGPYLAEIEARALPTDTRLSVDCRLSIRPAASPKRPAAETVLMAPLAALTLAYWSPVYALQAADSADRKAAARDGGALLAALRPGEPLPPGARDRAARWYEDRPGYALMAIDLGGGRQGAREFALVGVRSGVVEWIGTQGGHMGLCRDPQGRVSAARKGCTETGHYSPDR